MLGYIGWPLALLFIWDIAVTVAYVYIPHPGLELPVLPMSLLGSALALFSVFETTAPMPDGGRPAHFGAPWSTLPGPMAGKSIT